MKQDDDRPVQCPAAIWRKFTRLQKVMYEDLYYAFNLDVLYPPKLVTTAKDREIIAHNMACQAVWALAESFS